MNEDSGDAKDIKTVQTDEHNTFSPLPMVITVPISSQHSEASPADTTFLTVQAVDSDTNDQVQGTSDVVVKDVGSLVETSDAVVDTASAPVEVVTVAPESVTVTPTDSQAKDEDSTSADGKQYLIVTANGTATLGMGTLQPLPDVEGEPPMKKFRIQGEDGQFYILSVPGDPQVNNLAETTDPSTEHQYTTKQNELLNETVKSLEKRNQLLGSDVSQAWFTTRDDKNILQNHGASWKQGQWTKDEIDILQININEYCREHNISDPTEIIFEMSKDERKEFYRTVAKGLQRPLFSVYRRVTRMYDQKNHMGKYSGDEITKLRELRHKHGNDWATIGQALGRSASSVKDKCRLMKDTCNSGKWLPEEEMRLSKAVYEFVGCQPGEDVVHGLSWAQVAEKVITRSEKQCRTKWLNYMNWKQKGGKEWSREDDMNLIIRVANLGVNDDTEIDWSDLSKNWDSVRSPQWLRGKWWSLKRHIADYSLISFSELLENMKTFFLQNVRVRNTLGTARTRRIDAGPEMLTYVPITLNSGMPNENSPLEDLDPTVQAYEVLHQLPNHSGSYIITHPAGNQQLQTSLSEHIIVQTVPIAQNTDNDLGLQSRVVIRVPSSSDLSDTGVTALENADLGTSIQLSSTIDQGQQGLESLSEGNVIPQTDSLSDDTTFHTHNLEESVISSPVEIRIKPEQYVQSASTNDQLMTSFSDPMLNSDSNSLMESASDIDTDKTHQEDLIVNI